MEKVPALKYNNNYRKSSCCNKIFYSYILERFEKIKKNENKTLHKDTFIKIFKYTGDFAKLRSKDLKQKA